MDLTDRYEFKIEIYFMEMKYISILYIFRLSDSFESILY